MGIPPLVSSSYRTIAVSPLPLPLPPPPPPPPVAKITKMVCTVCCHEQYQDQNFTLVVRVHSFLWSLFGCALQDGSTPLHLASRGGHLDVINKLIVAKADVNATTNVSGVIEICWMYCVWTDIFGYVLTSNITETWNKNASEPCNSAVLSSRMLPALQCMYVSFWTMLYKYQYHAKARCELNVLS